MSELHKSNYIKTLSKMKAIIVTKENNRIEGKVCLLGDYIVTLDVKRKCIDKQLLINLYNEGIMASDNTFW